MNKVKLNEKIQLVILAVQAYKKFICYDNRLKNVNENNNFDYWLKCKEYYNSLDLPAEMKKNNYHFVAVMTYPIEKTMDTQMEDLSKKFTFPYTKI